MSTTRRTTILAASALLLFAALPGCGPVTQQARVRVHYEQLANFHDYRLAPDAAGSHGAGDGMFILYRVTQIQNTGSSAVPFAFEKFKVATVTPDQTSNQTVNADNILLGNRLIATPLNVAPGQTLSSGRCFIKQALTPNPQSLANTGATVELLYQINTAQPVSMVRVPGNTSVALLSNALPSALQNLCN